MASENVALRKLFVRVLRGFATELYGMGMALSALLMAFIGTTATLVVAGTLTLLYAALSWSGERQPAGADAAESDAD